MESLDGILVTGGEDENLRLYGSHPDLRCGTLSPKRDEFEIQLIEETLKANKSLLGTCRGIQILSVYFGGALYKDISDYEESLRAKGPDSGRNCELVNERLRPFGEDTIHALSHQFEKVPRWYKAHRVRLLESSLQRLYGKAEIELNSYHH